MDMSLFLFGALGALLTVYLAKQEVIPEFRPLFEISEKEKEVIEHQDHIRMTEKHIDDIQAKLEAGSLDEDYAARLTTVLNTSLSELQAERNRLKMLERDIKQKQIISRGLGFLFYIALGGVFGSLLAGRVQVGGLSGDLPNVFESIMIGATWTTYLSAIGFRAGEKKAAERIEDGKNETAEEIEAFKKKITEIVSQEVANAERAEKVEQPIYAGDVARRVAEELDIANIRMQKRWNLTKQMVEKDMKGVL